MQIYHTQFLQREPKKYTSAQQSGLPCMCALAFKMSTHLKFKCALFHSPLNRNAVQQLAERGLSRAR